MKHEHPHKSKLSPEELQLINRLGEHPELMERFQTILEITANPDGPIKRADEVEALLIEQMRRLGNASLESWASRAERTLGEQLKQKDPSAVVRKKNSDVVVRVRLVIGADSKTAARSPVTWDFAQVSTVPV